MSSCFLKFGPQIFFFLLRSLDSLYKRATFKVKLPADMSQCFYPNHLFCLQDTVYHHNSDFKMPLSAAHVWDKLNKPRLPLQYWTLQTHEASGSWVNAGRVNAASAATLLLLFITVCLPVIGLKVLNLGANAEGKINWPVVNSLTLPRM